MTATTSHQQLQVEQRIVEDALGFQQVVVEQRVDLPWLLDRLLGVLDSDVALRNELRTALLNAGGPRRALAVGTICSDSRVLAATTMVETPAEADRLRQRLDEEGMEPDRCRTGCGSYAVDPSGYCDADLDGREHRGVA